MNKKITGNIGESAAVSYLKKNKYKILDRNFSTKFGEIDIIAKNKTCISFIEVKTRNENMLYAPCEAVTYSKQQKIVKTAIMYLQNNRYDLYKSFDIIEVYTNEDTVEKINHIKNAFAVKI